MGPTQAIGDRERRGQLLSLVVICVLLAGCRLWLSHADEIVAAENRLDQVRYLEMARELMRGRWLGEFQPLTLIREPGYPLWVALTHQLGLPLRLANDLLLLAASALFCASLLSVGVSRGVASAAYAALIFEPHTLVVHRDALPASFYLPVLLCALAGLIWCRQAREWRRLMLHATWAGLALGVLWATRPEKPILLLPVLTIAVFDAASGRRRGRSWSRVLGRSAVLAASIACGIAVVAGGIAAVNYRHYDVFATTGVGGSGYLAANRALLGIEHAAPRRFVPVPRDVRERAYAASPAFRELAPILEAPSWARAVSCNVDGVCDDIGAGYFRWLLREAVAATGHMESHADGERFFRRIADELSAACRSGELPCRRSRTSFLHPYPHTWRSHFGESFRQLAGVAMGSGTPALWDAPADRVGTAAGVLRLFDEVAGRSGLTGNGRVTLRGRASSDSDPIERVMLQTSRQRVRSSAGSPSARDGTAGDGELAFAFAVDKRTRDFAAEAPLLVFEHRSGAITRLGLYRLLNQGAAGEELRVTIDVFEEEGRESWARRIVRTALWLAHPFGYAALSALGLLGFALLLLPRRSGRFVTPEVTVVVMLVVLAVARLVLVTLVDVSSFPARSSRHIVAAVPFWGCAMLLLIEAGVRNLRRPRESGEGRSVDAK